MLLLIGVSKNRETEKIITTIINIFQQIPAAGPKFIDILCQLVLNNEKSMLIGPSSPFREPLMKFLLRFPGETVQLFLQDNNIKVTLPFSLAPQFTTKNNFIIVITIIFIVPLLKFYFINYLKKDPHLMILQ